MGEVSLKKAIQKLNHGGADVKIGVVKSESPLVIAPENDEKLSLGLGSLCVPEHLTNHSVAVNIPALGLEQGTMQVQGALRKGERVFLVSVAQGKKYVVIGRLGK